MNWIQQLAAIHHPPKRDLMREIYAAVGDGEYANADIAAKTGLGGDIVGTYLTGLYRRGKVDRRGSRGRYLYFRPKK